MMKLRYSPSESISFEAEVGTVKAAFEQIAELQEVFQGHDQCGLCQSKAVQFSVREFSGNSYYKMLCTSCRATLDFGQKREGGALFPKVFDKETRQSLPNGGWYIYGEQEKPGGSPTPAKPLHGEAELKGFRDKCGKFLKGNHTLEAWNAFWKQNYPLCPKDERDDLWKEIEDYAEASQWTFDRAAKQFVSLVGSSNDTPF